MTFPNPTYARDVTYWMGVADALNEISIRLSALAQIAKGNNRIVTAVEVVNLLKDVTDEVQQAVKNI